jgi:hypothetical protein
MKKAKNEMWKKTPEIKYLDGGREKKLISGEGGGGIASDHNIDLVYIGDA